MKILEVGNVYKNHMGDVLYNSMNRWILKICLSMWKVSECTEACGDERKGNKIV